ncbi:MAG TPA: helix-turn-helix domain-containing protein, partial [Giesbergeria sp.]|nr:helix-turn-helix domain-containing protein [Giesbergeria sp.]
ALGEAMRDRPRQRQAIEAALARHRGQWARAARELEIDPSNLHKLAKRLGMKA